MPEIPLIPRATLFGKPSRFQARLSPDGACLTRLAALEGMLNLWLAPVGDVAAAEPLTRRKDRPIAWQDSSWDGRHILFMHDENGEENWRISTVDRVRAWSATSRRRPGSAPGSFWNRRTQPGILLVGLNDRDRKWHDVWSIDLATAERRLVLENTSEFWSFNFDWQLNLRLGRKAASHGGGSRLYRLTGAKAEPWLDIPHADEMTTWPLHFNHAGDAFTMMSSLGRDRAALMGVDAASRAENDDGGARQGRHRRLENLECHRGQPSQAGMDRAHPGDRRQSAVPANEPRHRRVLPT
jgi:hypothetical protein